MTDCFREWHTACVTPSSAVPILGSGRLTSLFQQLWRVETMSWTKPEAEVVAVTMEVTAYVATL